MENKKRRKAIWQGSAALCRRRHGHLTLCHSLIPRHSLALRCCLLLRRNLALRCFLLLCCNLALCGVVWGAEERNKITSVSLNVRSTIQSGGPGGEVSVTVSGGECHAGEVSILNDDEDWMGGMTPQVSVELYANEGYYFAGTSKGMFAFTGDDAVYVSARRTDNNETIVLRFKLGKLENGDLTVSGARWSGSGNAVWDKNPNARYYQVRLYRGNSSVTSTRTADDPEYDFADNITRRGDYYFEVRAVGSGSEKGDWASSDSWYVSSAEAEDLGGYRDGPGGWNDSRHGPGVSDSYGDSSRGPGTASNYSGGPGISTGSGAHWCLDQKGWWFQHPDNTYPYNCWQCIDGSWYCFNEYGYIRYGWLYWQEKWYYCGPDGALMANTWTPDGYYVGSDGVWIP